MIRSPNVSRRSVTRGLAAALIATPVGMMIRSAWAQARRAGTLTTLITPEPPLLVPGVNNQGAALIVSSKIFGGFSPTRRRSSLSQRSR
jgi:peptide/nickel transport system substrate-binding protein